MKNLLILDAGTLGTMMDYLIKIAAKN